MDKIPIIINNRNLLTWPSKMVEVCKTFQNVGEILIVDNASTYEPLLEWYKTNPCEIIYTTNNGHTSPWILNLPKVRNFKYYVVSDPDLDLTETPKDCLLVLKEKLYKYKEYSKIGLSLSNWEVSLDSPYYHHLNNWSKITWDELSIVDGLLTNQDVDTTFALYDINREKSGKSCSLNLPYSAKHIPWEITKQTLKKLEDEFYEYYFYLLNADSSSSYKSFVNFNHIYKNE